MAKALYIYAVMDLSGKVSKALCHAEDRFQQILHEMIS